VMIAMRAIFGGKTRLDRFIATPPLFLPVRGPWSRVGPD
jgi:hypothetical protein